MHVRPSRVRAGWEPVFLLFRLIIVGFMQWIPARTGSTLMRLWAALLVTLLYTIVLMFTQPFKRNDLDVLAITAAITLLAFFIAAINVKLFTLLVQESGQELAEMITGFPSAAWIGGVIFGFNVINAAIFLLLTGYQMRMQRNTHSIRLVSSGHVPELRLIEGMRWHLFLSHIWVQPREARTLWSLACALKDQRSRRRAAVERTGPGRHHQAPAAALAARRAHLPRRR